MPKDSIVKGIVGAAKALDMSHAARMKRAEKMGFDTSKKFFHGTKADIAAFEKEALGSSTNAGSAKQGFFFATDPGTASDYASLSPHRSKLRGAVDERKVAAELDSVHNKIKKKYGEEWQKHRDFSKGYNENKKEYEELFSKSELKEMLARPFPKDGDPLLKEWDEVNQRYSEAIDLRSGENLPEVREHPDVVAIRKQLQDAVKESAKDTEHWQIKTPRREKVNKLQDELHEAIERVRIEQETDGINVIPTHLKLKNPYVHDFKGAEYREVTYAELMTEAKKKGHDGVIFKNTYDPANPENRVKQDIVAVFEPEQIRSTNAKFDPKNKKSGNILAGGAGAAAVAAGTASSDSWAADLQDPVKSGMKEVGDQLDSMIKRFDSYTGQPVRAAAKAALEGENPFNAARENFGKENGVTGQEVARSFLDKNPQMGVTMPDGSREYPAEAPLGFAADVALDPTNLVGAGSVNHVVRRLLPAVKYPGEMLKLIKVLKGAP